MPLLQQLFIFSVCFYTFIFLRPVVFSLILHLGFANQ